MNGDVFGNLREWGKVPEQIAAMTAEGTLDKHQAGLVRILRYRDNWRLREVVLTSIKHLKTPTAELFGEVLGIAVDDELYYGPRILASQALAELLTRQGVQFPEDRHSLVQLVAEKMQTILVTPQHPVVHHAVRKSLAAICSGA